MRAIALFLTVLTGFSGLVYQVVWQKYLAVLLGSHSEATAAVLGIFLGGLSYGYLLFGRVCRRLVETAPPGRARARVVFAYGLVEVGIGVYALAFSMLFALARSVSLALPAGSESLAFALDIGLTALLIGPPTVLMGGTIPLLTQGLARGVEDATRFHAWVYAFNTTGAFAGALCAGFVLIPLLGLRDSVIAMGVVNLAAGVVFLALSRRGVEADGDPATAEAVPQDSGSGGARPAFAALATTATLAGFAMMTLQTALNRIGALAFGASQFTFSMVVATFVLSIAVGSFVVSFLPRISSRLLPFSQWALVAYLMALYPLVDDAPYWAHRLRVLFGLDGSAFLPFHVAVFGMLLAILIVPLSLSGALLPLIFHELRRKAADLGLVAGSLYSWNTVGSLLGALVGGFALFFWLDLHHAYRIAVLALAGGAAILSVGRITGSFGTRRGAGAAFAAVAAGLVLLPGWSPVNLSSGLFRFRETFEYTHSGAEALFASKQEVLGDDFVRFYRDDPIASIAVHRLGPGALAILTNGKVDGNIPRDNKTQGLVALLPALLARGEERAFVIGYGTGMTVGELAALESYREVVVAEISPAVIEAAPLFESMNRGALSSPKTRIVRSDAYRALLRSPGGFDVIASEPSNPWVTGVEMLYSEEFLQAARARLAPGGVFAQWFHIYESDAATIGLVLRTYLQAFDRVAVWYGEPPDLIVLGFAEEAGGVDFERLARRIEQPDFKSQLSSLGLAPLPRLLAHELIPTGVLSRDALPGPIHTLEVPRLSDTAARAFFEGGEGQLPSIAAPHDSATSVWRLFRQRFANGQPPDEDRLELLRETCLHSLHRCSTLFAEWLHDDPDSPVLAESLARARSNESLARALDESLLRTLASFFEEEDAASTPEAEATYQLHFHHAAPFRKNGHGTAVRTDDRKLSQNRNP